MKLPVFPVEGGCQCGAVRYRLNAAPLGIYSCHCKDCQRFSGTTHTMARPVGNIWTDRAQPWVHIDPDVPNFAGQPADRQPLFDAFAAEVAKG